MNESESKRANCRIVDYSLVWILYFFGTWMATSLTAPVLVSEHRGTPPTVAVVFSKGSNFLNGTRPLAHPCTHHPHPRPVFSVDSTASPIIFFPIHICTKKIFLPPPFPVFVVRIKLRVATHTRQTHRQTRRHSPSVYFFSQSGFLIGYILKTRVLAPTTTSVGPPDTIPYRSVSRHVLYKNKPLVTHKTQHGVRRFSPPEGKGAGPRRRLLFLLLTTISQKQQKPEANSPLTHLSGAIYRTVATRVWRSSSR